MSTLHDLDMSHEPAPYTTPPPVASPVAPEAGAALSAFERAADAFRRGHVFHRIRVSDFESAIEREEPSLMTGSPSDAEIARDQLSDLARVAVPLMGDEIQRLLTAGQWLIDHAATLRTRLAEAEEARKAEVAGLLEEFGAGCAPVRCEGGVTDYFRGVNTERAKNLHWARLMCQQLTGQPLQTLGGAPAGIQEKGGANG